MQKSKNEADRLRRENKEKDSQISSLSAKVALSYYAAYLFGVREVILNTELDLSSRVTLPDEDHSEPRRCKVGWPVPLLIAICRQFYARYPFTAEWIDKSIEKRASE